MSALKSPSKSAINNPPNPSVANRVSDKFLPETTSYYIPSAHDTNL